VAGARPGGAMLPAVADHVEIFVRAAEDGYFYAIAVKIEDDRLVAAIPIPVAVAVVTVTIAVTVVVVVIVVIVVIVIFRVGQVGERVVNFREFRKIENGHKGGYRINSKSPLKVLDEFRALFNGRRLFR